MATKYKKVNAIEVETTLCIYESLIERFSGMTRCQDDVDMLIDGAFNKGVIAIQRLSNWCKGEIIEALELPTDFLVETDYLIISCPDDTSQE